MGILGTIIQAIIVGAIAGFIARAVVPGRQNMSIGLTILLGIGGSLLAGAVGYLLGHDTANGFFQLSGIIGSIIGAIVVLFIWVAAHRGSGRAV